MDETSFLLLCLISSQRAAPGSSSLWRSFSAVVRDEGFSNASQAKESFPTRVTTLTARETCADPGADPDCFTSLNCCICCKLQNILSPINLEKGQFAEDNQSYVLLLANAIEPTGNTECLINRSILHELGHALRPSVRGVAFDWNNPRSSGATLLHMQQKLHALESLIYL